MDILKVKQTSKGEVVIEYIDKGVYGDHLDNKTLRSYERPLPEFEIALQALRPIVCRMLELPDGYANNMDILGVTQSRGEESDQDDVTISAAKRLSNDKVACMNTPHMRIADVSELTSLLITLDAQAEAYVRGERAQGELDLGEEAA